MEQNAFARFGEAHADTSDKALDWDSEIVDSGESFVILLPGTYDFTVKKLERKHYAGGAKMPPCPQAQLTLTVHGGDKGEAHTITNLFLTQKQAWKLAQFFVSLGLAEPGGKLQMDWNKVIGSSGRLELANREYNGKLYNDVSRFLPPEKAPAGATGGYNAGTF